MRRAAFAALLALLLLAPPASAHGGGDVDHVDTPQDLADVDIPAVVRTAQRSADPAAAAADDGLPSDWTCTTEQHADTPDLSASPQIHVVYAYAKDAPDHFDAWADRLQADVSVVQRFLSAQSGGQKALRFDMGTACGRTDELDITSLELPRTRDAYLAMDVDHRFDAVADDTWAALGGNGPTRARNVLILADNLTSATGSWLGLGELLSDDTPGPSNASNRGGLTSILWATSKSPEDDGGRLHPTWWPEGFLHEITHNLGGVQDSSEHATPFGHCWDEHDVMCYDDGAGIGMVNMCPSGQGTIDEVYDCGKDDYYAPAPPPGSYLATHWNLYDSAFMADCGEVAPACGGGPGPPPAPPVPSLPPAIAGTPEIGGTLTATRGTWLNAPTYYGYRWQRETTFGWKAIAGATTAAYTPTSADVGLRLRAVVTATNPDGAVMAASEPTASVAGDDPPAPTPTPSPTPAPPPAPRVTTGSAWLTVTAGSPHGRRLGRVAFTAPGAGAVTTRALRIARPSGRYAVELCAKPAGGAVRACTTKRLRARAGRLTLPALTVRVGADRRVTVSLAVRSLTQRATARTRGTVSLDV